MDFLSSLHNLMDAGSLLQSFGPYILLGVAVVIFIPFLPGDSLLVTAAILRHELDINAWLLFVVAAVAAFAGDQVGFYLGRRFGRKLFKDDARVLRTEHLDSAEDFFQRHGPVALVLGRFVPIVRTFVPFAAGTAEMGYSSFLRWNILGGIGWVGSMLLVGVLLGGIPGIAHSIDIIMLIVVAISVLPMIIGWINKRRKGKTRNPGHVRTFILYPAGIAVRLGRI